MNMPTTPPDALVRALELEGGSPTRSPRARSPDAASVPSSPASAFSARSESARRALSPHASISKMAQSTDDWDRDDEWRSPARASPSTTGRRRADGLEALSSSEDGDDDFDDERSTGRESAFHTPAAHLLNATSTTTSSRCNTEKSSALGRDADEWMREARERIADLEISSSPIDPSNDDRSVSISPGGLPATPTRTSPAPRVDAATKVSREVDAMIFKAAARAEAAAAAAANRSARLAMTGPLRTSPAAVERAGRDADAAREATARRLEVEAAAAEAEAARMLAEAARKREEAAAAEALAESAEASMAESAQLCVDDASPRATYSPYSTRGHDASCSSFDSALDVTTVSAGTIETAIENKETVSLLRAVGAAPGEGSMGAPAPSSSTRTSAPTGPYPTSWEDALNDILASVPSPLVSPIEKAATSPSPIEAVAHEYQYLEVKNVETRTTEESEEAVTPTTGQMLEISARERAVQTELDMLDDRYRTVVASRRRELLEATLAERDAVAEELARRQVVEAASAPNPATHVASSPRPSPRSPARSPARPSPRSSPAKNAAEECPEQCPTRSTDPCADERPPWTDRLAAPSPTSAATPTSAARRTFLRRGTGNGGAPVTGNATPSPATKERTSQTPATREDTLRHEFIASVERERERHRARSASRTPGSAGLSSRRRTLGASKSPARVRAPSHPTPDYSAVEPRYMSAAEAKSSAPWRGSPYTPSWRPNGYNNNRVDDHGSSPAEEAGARSVDARARTPPRRSVTPEPRRRAPPRATPVKQVDKKTPNKTPGARKVNPNPKPSTPMRFGSTPEGKDGSTPSAAYVEAAENMRRSLKRLSAASEAADLILMRSTAAVVAADEEKKCADRGGLEATFIDAFRGAEKGDARRSPKAKASSPEPANDFERQFLAAYRKYAATPSPVPAPKEEIVPSAWIPSMPPTPEANKPAPASPRVNKSAPPSKKSPTAAKVTRESTKPKPKPATSMEAARASLARLNAATNAKDGEYTPPSPQQQQPNVVEEPKAESPAVKLFSEKMSAPSPVKHRKPEPVVETTKAPVNLVAVDSDSDDDPLLGLDENADIRRFLGTPGRRREESAKSPLTSLGVNHNSPRPGSSKATAEMQKPATVPVATSVPVAPALAPALDKDKRKREDREVEDFEALLSLDPSQPRPARKLSGGADANTAASTQRKPVHAKKPSAPLPVPTAAVPRIRGRSSLLTRPAVEPKLPASAATFQQKTRGLNAGSVLSRSRREYEDEKVARLKEEAEECTFSPRTIGTPAYLKKKRAGGGSGKKKEVRYAELPMRGSSAWR